MPFQTLGSTQSGVYQDRRRYRPACVPPTVPVFSELDYAPFYLGTDKGYFAAEGLEVELVGAGGSVATPALISGDVQFSGSPSAAISAILKGAPLKIIYVMRDRPP